MSRKTQLCKALVALSIATPTVFADTITAIYGGGNPDTGWTTDTGGNIQLGLRAKNRTTGDTSNVGGVYSFATAPSPRGLWNYEFSINSNASGVSGGANLDAYNFYLAVDRDPSAGTSFQVINPLTYWLDNSYGNNSTANGAGVEGLFAILGPLSNIAQNSQNITFGDYPGGALPLDANATYTYDLYATAKGDTSGRHIADVSIDVVVGNGGARVPEGGSSVMMLGLGLVGLVGLGLRKQKVA
jgi:hypothetical protein